MTVHERTAVVVPRLPRVGRGAPDVALGLLARGAATSVLAMLVVLVLVAGRAAAPAVERFGASFLTSTEWRANEIERPAKDAAGRVVMEDGEVVLETLPPTFGALPALYGTATSAALALLLAMPIGVLAAVLFVRAGARSRAVRATAAAVELLATIPSIAFGMWGLFVLAPFLQRYVEPLLSSTRPATGRDLLCGALVLSVMVAPIVVAVSRDVLRAVPTSITEGAIALGATWWQTSWIMIRESRAGLFGAAVLAYARAAGETMAVTMVIGNANRIDGSLLAPAQTMASLLANEFAEASSDLHRGALLEIALLLLVLSLALNVVARRLVVGRRA